MTISQYPWSSWNSFRNLSFWIWGTVLSRQWASTQLTSGTINYMLNMSWHCFLEGLDCSIPQISSNDLVQDKAWKPKQGCAASDSERCMDEHWWKGSWQPCTTYFLTFPSCKYFLTFPSCNQSAIRFFFLKSIILAYFFTNSFHFLQ